MFNRLKLGKTATAAFGFCAIALSAVPSSAQGVLEACEPELLEYCGEIEPGHGRVLSCLYANETRISETCGEAFVDIADIIDGLFFTIGSTLAICAADLEKHCTGTQFGGGRLISCLSEVQTDLEPECGSIVSELAPELAD